MPSKYYSEQYIQSISFVVVLAVFSLVSVASCLTQHPPISQQENRLLAQFPKIHTASKDLVKFPSAFEQFYNDRFPLRLEMISAKNYLAYRVFNCSGNPLVSIGRQNWLFYNSYGILPAQLNTQPFSKRELQNWVQNLQARKTFCDQLGIKYLLVIAPEKGTMYPEYLPSTWNRRSGISRLEQLQDYLREHTEIDFLDAKALLSKEKQQGHKIYHSNDTHWNQRSAFLVSQQLLAHLHRTLPSVTPTPSEDLLDGHDKFTGDLSKMLGLQNVLTDESPSIVCRTPPRAIPDNTHLASMDSDQPAFGAKLGNQDLPKALVMRDSFFTYLTAPVSEHFSYTEFQWTNHFRPEQIAASHPNVIINEIAERHLYEEFYEHVPTFNTPNSSTAAARNGICAFGDNFDLVGLTAEKLATGAVLRLKWRSKMNVKLDYTIGLQCLSQQGKLTGGADYEPDLLHRQITRGTTWTDTVFVADRELKNASTLGILVYRKGENQLVCSTPGRAWDKRYEVTLSRITPEPSSRESIAESGGIAHL